MKSTKISPAYRTPFRIAAVQQLVAMVLFSMMLDGGRLARVGLIAAAAYWFVAVVIIVRRPRSPGMVDLVCIGWGFLVLLVLAFALSPVMGIQL